MNLLIRDMPDEVVAALDAEATRLGLSRTEFLRRTLTQASMKSDKSVTVADLSRFSETFSDLADPDIMAEAWQ